MISISVKADFFVHRPTAYTKQKVLTFSDENCVDFENDLSFLIIFIFFYK